jgi:hypothetical protein
MLRLTRFARFQQGGSFMTIAAPPPGLQPEDYEEIEAAVMETARGRWFLAEHARRARGAESARLLAAIERLEARLEAQQALAPLEAFTLADRLSEFSWALRERGVEDFVCGKIDALARELGGAGAFANRGASPAEPAPAPALVDAGPMVEPKDEASSAPPASAPVKALLQPVPPPNPEPQPPAPLAVDPRLPALSWLDRLPLADRLALFA